MLGELWDDFGIVGDLVVSRILPTRFLFYIHLYLSSHLRMISPALI
jgi:hypothetical protein